MDNFYNNLRESRLSIGGNAPLAGAIRNTVIPQNTARPSASEMSRWEDWRTEQANALADEKNRRREAAEAGTLVESDYNNPNRAAAYNGHLYATDDVRHYIDEKVFDNYKILQDMADEYEKIKSYSEGENVLKKYYDKIDGKTSRLNEMFNHFAYGNRILRDAEETDEENSTSPKEVADYMRYVFNAAKAKYGSRKI